MKSEDLIAAVFPDQIACLENIVGERQIPDHPLVEQTLDDCLHQAMDCEGWLALLRRIEQGRITLLSRDLPAPSPLAAAILNARPYTFLDDAPLEERRTQAVQSRRWGDVHNSDDLAALDPEAILAVQSEAWPSPGRSDEMHEALMSLACVTADEVKANAGWQSWLEELQATGRACFVQRDGGQGLWLARERLALLRALFPAAAITPEVSALPGFDQPFDYETALVEVLRARLGGFGPLTLEQIAWPLRLPVSELEQPLLRLEAEGYVMRGYFCSGEQSLQWCERHLLARIHRYTVKRLRREIEPVSLQDFMRFLFDWQHLSPATRLQGPAALSEVLGKLEGYAAAASAWESDLLPSRIRDYSPAWLDESCRAGKHVWARLGAGAASSTLRSTPLVLLPRTQLNLWRTYGPALDSSALSPKAQRVHAALSEHGALFFDELVSDAHLLPSELEIALQELVATGLVSADSFAGLRALITPASKRQSRSHRRGRGPLFGGMQDAGRWALLRKTLAADQSDDSLEHIARTLLRRYGVICWRLLEREADWLPSWRELLRCYHRLEARGEIRGGRFISGLAGEQFALPEAVALMREVRRRPLDNSLVAVSASDPLNLLGTLLPGNKVPALSGNRLLYRDGVAVATLTASSVEFLLEVELAEQAELRDRLIREPAIGGQHSRE